MCNDCIEQQFCIFPNCAYLSNNFCLMDTYRVQALNLPCCLAKSHFPPLCRVVGFCPGSWELEPRCPWRHCCNRNSSGIRLDVSEFTGYWRCRRETWRWSWSRGWILLFTAGDKCMLNINVSSWIFMHRTECHCLMLLNTALTISVPYWILMPNDEYWSGTHKQSTAWLKSYVSFCDFLAVPVSVLQTRAVWQMISYGSTVH